MRWVARTPPHGAARAHWQCLHIDQYSCRRRPTTYTEYLRVWFQSEHEFRWRGYARAGDLEPNDLAWRKILTDSSNEVRTHSERERSLRRRVIASYSEYVCGKKLMSTRVNAHLLDLTCLRSSLPACCLWRGFSRGGGIEDADSVWL